MDAFSAQTSFFVAAQTSIILGFLHGLSPCEHSWPILTPFAIGSKNMKRVMRIGTIFCLGTATACMALGALLGTIGSIVPSSWSIYMGAATSALLIILGLILVLNPSLLHLHDGEHDHDQKGEEQRQGYALAYHNSDYDDASIRGKPVRGSIFKHGIYWGMFTLGFINMIVPCPTSAVMYSYALIARSIWKGTAIFFAYAIATTIVLMCMAFLLVKATQLMKKFGQEKNEILITRISGVLIAAFGVYMVLIQFPAFKHLKFAWIM
jgi:nickel/cobalt exporter